MAGDERPYFSARLIFVTLVDDERPKKTNTYDEGIFLLRAADQDQAFERAVAIGREHETEYLNDHGQRVRQAFVEVDEIKYVGTRLEDQEVASIGFSKRTDEAIPYDQQFDPEASNPFVA